MYIGCIPLEKVDTCIPLEKVAPSHGIAEVALAWRAHSSMEDTPSNLPTGARETGASALRTPAGRLL